MPLLLTHSVVARTSLSVEVAMRMILNAGTPDEKIIEGTPEELAEFHRLDLGRPASPIAAAQPPSPLSAHGDRQYVSEEVAYRVLTRIRLSVEQKAVLSYLHRNHPDWVWAQELQEEIGYSPSQFSGLMGAFGRRLTHTEGYKYPCYFFQQEWDATRECNRYRLPEPVRVAMARAGLA